MHGTERFQDVELFRNGSVHEFYCLKALIITLRQVITPVVGKKKKENLHEQNFYGEANWAGVVSFHCIPIGLVMSIFGDSSRHVHQVSLIFVYSRTLVTQTLK